MRIKAKTLGYSFVVASLVLMGAAGGARADKWFVQGEKTIKSADPSVEITAEKGLVKEDVKKIKISVEGADVEITKIVLKWNNRGDETIANVGVLKAGGEWEKDAPGHEATLSSAVVQYKILNNAPTATLKVWGFD